MKDSNVKKELAEVADSMTKEELDALQSSIDEILAAHEFLEATEEAFYRQRLTKVEFVTVYGMAVTELSEKLGLATRID